MPRKQRKLAISNLPLMLETQRRLYSDIDDNLADSQLEKLRTCLQLWRTKDSPSRQWANNRARSSLAMVYKDKGLGPPLFLLCSLSMSVTQLGLLDPVEVITEIRKWWRRVEIGTPPLAPDIRLLKQDTPTYLHILFHAVG